MILKHRILYAYALYLCYVLYKHYCYLKKIESKYYMLITTLKSYSEVSPICAICSYNL